jgi:protein TonB
MFFAVFMHYSTSSINAQVTITPVESEPEDNSKDSTDRIFDVVDEEPEFIGGDISLQKFIKENVKYPKKAVKKKEQGRVYVKFIVEKDGSISNVQIARGATKLLDAEAVRVIKLMPKWKPGTQKGKPVRTRVMVPIVFKL